MILRNPGEGALRRIARQLAKWILRRVSGKIITRWISPLLAPVFAKLSYNATRDVGLCAMRSFAPAK